MNVWISAKSLIKLYCLGRKEDFYSNLNLEDTKDSDYNHAQRICKDFEIKNLGEYYDLYLKSNTFPAGTATL